MGSYKNRGVGMLGMDLSNAKDCSVATLHISGEEVWSMPIKDFKVDTVQLEPVNRCHSRSGIIGATTGTFKIKNPKKFAYEIFGVKNGYHRHLRRVKNRKILSEKLKRRGRK